MAHRLQGGWRLIAHKRLAVPTVASASVPPHSHGPAPRGHAHTEREPAQPFAELLDTVSDPDSAQTSGAEAKDSSAPEPAHARDTNEPKDCKAGKSEKCE